MHDSLRQLYTLLASGAISPRRAAVLGYLTSLLLRTLPAVYNNPLPLAGTLMCAAELAERDKAKSPSTRASQPAAPLTQKTMPTQKTPPAQQAAPTQKLTPTAPTSSLALTNKTVPQTSAPPTSMPPDHSTPPADTAHTGDYLDCGQGRPLPGTRAEFAAQVLKSVSSTPPTPTSQISTKPNINPPLQASPSASPGKTTTEAPPEPANPPQAKKATR